MPIDNLGVFLLIINDSLILVANESYYLSIKLCLYLSDGIDIIKSLHIYLQNQYSASYRQVKLQQIFTDYQCIIIFNNLY